MNSSAFAARAAARSSSGLASGLPMRMLSSTVPWKSHVSWLTSAMRRRIWSRLSARRSRPPIATRPRSGSWNRSKSRAIVDLPAPLGPTIATRSPGRTAKLRSSWATRREPG